MTNSVPRLKTHFKKDALRCVDILQKCVTEIGISEDAKRIINNFLKVEYGQVEDKVKIIIMSTYMTFLGKMDLNDKEAPVNKEIQQKLLSDLSMLRKALAPGKA